MTVAILANFLSAQSTFGQAFITSFYSQDYEDLSVGHHLRNLEGGSRLASGFRRFGSIGYSHRSRVVDSIGNPGKAGELNADFSWNDPNQDAPEGDRSLIHRFDESNTSAVVRDLTDPNTQIRWEFDLWTSETSPVAVSSAIEHPSRGVLVTATWWGIDGDYWQNRDNRVTVTNDQANTWQSHVIDFYAFGLTQEDRIERAMLFEGFAVSEMSWRISTDDWGHGSENIMRLDNVKMSIIPEPSEYAFLVGVCLIAFIAHRRMRAAN